jgi:hypothetical protein
LGFQHLHGSLRRRYDKVQDFESKKTVTSTIREKNVGGFQFIVAIEETEHHGDLAITPGNPQLRDEILRDIPRNSFSVHKKEAIISISRHSQPCPLL